MWFIKIGTIICLTSFIIATPIKNSPSTALTPPNISQENLVYLLQNPQFRQLLNSPGISSKIQDELEESQSKSIEAKLPNVYSTDLQLPIKETSDFYTPDYQKKDASEENIEVESEETNFLRNLQPPAISNEPNYWGEKPRKFSKKYSSTEKLINLKNKSDDQDKFDSYEPQQNQGYFYDDFDYSLDDKYVVPDSVKQEQEEELIKDSSKMVPVSVVDTLNSGEVLPRLSGTDNKDDRVEFQMHGFDGPKSYKFGYDTGKG